MIEKGEYVWLLFLFFEHKRHKSWRFVFICFVPPFLEFLKAEFTAFGSVEEIGYVMHKRLNFHCSVSRLKVCLRSLILPKGVKFTDKEMTIIGQYPECF